MLHKFKVKDTGTVFYYSNETNALYDKYKNLLSNPLGKLDNAQAPNEVTSDGRVVKSSAPREIKIVFGHKCNFSCSYCTQRDIGDHDAEHMPRAEARTKATLLIDKMKNSLDLSRLEQLELWGGEILLYWPEVQEVMLAFDRPDFDFVLPTNGTLLKESHIDFFRSLQGRVTVELSHDGPKHELTRGPDFFDKKAAPVLRYVEQFPNKVRVVLNCVLSKNNFNLRQMNDFFREFFIRHNLKPIPIIFLPLIVYDRVSRRQSFEDDVDEYGARLKEFLDDHIAQFKRLGKVTDDEMIQTALFHVVQDGDDNNGILQWAAKMRSELHNLESTICGMHQVDKLVIDIEGNLKACQNVGESVDNGNITDFVIDTTPKIINGMNTQHGADKCTKCPVFLQCLRGCPLDINAESFEVNCKLSTVHNMTKLLAAMKIVWNSDVEWLGADE